MTKLSALAFGRDGDFTSPFSLLEDDNLDNIIKRGSRGFNIKSQSDLIYASEYVEAKHKSYLDIVSKRLNKVNCTEFSTEFWKRAFSQGLLRQITFLHQTFRILEDSFDPNNFHFKTISKKDFKTFDNFEDQRNYLGGSYLAQEQLFSLYIGCFYPKIISENFSLKHKFSVRKFFEGFKYKTINLIKEIIKKLLRWKIKNSCKVLLLGCYFEKKYISLLKEKSKNNIYYIPEIRNDKFHKYDANKRSHLHVTCETFDRFDKFFFYTLKYLLPTHYLEGFSDNLRYYQKLLSNFRNLEFIVSEAWLSHTNINLFRAYAYEMKEVKTYYNEHNCIFHPFDGNYVSFISNNVDRFLTFGWSSNSPNFISTASLFPFKIKNPRRIKNIDILYVSNPCEYFFPFYSTSYSNWGYGSVKHLHFVKNFLSTLPDIIKKSMSYRAYPSDYQISGLRFHKEDLLSEYLSDVNFVNSSKFKGETCKEQMLSSKIVVIDFLSTSYLEALHMNIPVICFWDSETMSLKDEYSNFFDDLVEAQIMHTNPMSAVRHLEKVYSDPQVWWQSREVQNLKDQWLKKNFGEENILLNYLFELAA